MSDDISIPPPGFYNERGRVSQPPAGGFSTSRIALAILAVVGVGAIGASIVHYRSGPVPVIQADTNPIRVRPDNPGGLQIAGANNDILSGGNDTTNSRLAAAPEVPNPSALHAETPPPAVAPAAVPTPPAAVAPPVPVPRPKPPTVAATVPPPPAHAVAPGRGKGVIQLAALETEAAARTEWQTMARKFPELAGHEPVFSRIERAGKVYWRVRTGGFADAEQAKVACEKIKARHGTCTVAD